VLFLLFGGVKVLNTSFLDELGERRNGMNKMLIAGALTIVVVMAIAVAAVTLNSPNNQEPSVSASPTSSPSPVVTASSSPTASSNPTASSSPNPTASPTADQSGVITFTAPVQILETHFTNDRTKTTTYEVWAYASWNPPSYVRYYEVSLSYNNNSKPLTNSWVSADFREWSTPGNELFPFPWTENKVYVIGPEGVSHPSGQPYRGLYDNPETWVMMLEDGTKVNGPSLWGTNEHGVVICSIMTTIKDSENISGAAMGQIQTDMQKFLADYTQSWIVTLKNVS
jgi:hypothetical protein